MQGEMLVDRYIAGDHTKLTPHYAAIADRSRETRIAIRFSVPHLLPLG
jgi:hypothetical protein